LGLGAVERQPCAWEELRQTLVCALHEHKHTLIQAIIKFQKCKYIL